MPAFLPDELSMLKDIGSLREKNVSVRAKIETATYFRFMFAVISGGLATAGEIRSLLR